MRKLLSRGFCFAVLVGTAYAQQPIPPLTASHATIVRITLGSSSGMSGCGSQTIVAHGTIRLASNDPETSTGVDGTVRYEGCPSATMTTKRVFTITKRDWNAVVGSVKISDVAALQASTQCSPCVDGPETWVRLELSDGTNVGSSYDPSNPPKALNFLLRQISQVERKEAVASRGKGN